MLKILHSGNQPSLDIDQTAFTGNLEHDSALPYIQGLKAGRLVSIGSNGFVKLADGLSTDKPVVGFLILDAAGYFFENKPALASGKVSVAQGDCVVITDQIDLSESFSPGDKLFAGTGAEVGLVTKTPPDATSEMIGVAGSSASAASPELKIYVR